MSGIAVVGLVTAFGAIGASPGSAAGAPSGQRMYGNTTFDAASGHFVGGGGAIEPAYDDMTGTLVYLQTPNNPPVHPANHIDPSTGLPKNVAPLYLPVYPDGSGIDPATLNCAHIPADNCPDHGPGIAGAAAAIEPAVYKDPTTGKNLVIGHDHLVGIASTGGDFNVLWEPVAVFFTSVAAAATHPVTLADLKAIEAKGGAFEIPLPADTFHCGSVSAAAYARATPAPGVVGP
ncbi:MAG TPA: hypothetical protein VN636_12670 [Acidimicrobiia bacterium]|nr:hypothetical protein [Acidimicrobiia bacterium]